MHRLALRELLRRAAPLAALALAACSARWEGPTYFVFENLDPALQPRVKSAVAAYGFQPLLADEAQALAVREEDFAFRLAAIRGSAQLQEARNAIDAALREFAVVAEPLRIELRFACVAVPASGSGSTLVARGRATPGALVRLDVGDGETIAITVLEDGVWDVAIPSSEALLQRGGWIYGEAVRGAARQLFRLNLLTGAQEPIEARDLPSGGALR